MTLLLFCRMKTELFKIPGAKDRNIVLDSRYQPSPLREKDCVILYHGFKGFKDWGHFNAVADRFAENDMLAVKYNGSYNGLEDDFDAREITLPEVFGNNTFSIEMDDMGLVIDWVNRQDWPFMIKNIFLVGHSRGGGLVLLKAAEDKRVKKVVTWASVYEYGRIWGEQLMKLWKKEGKHEVKNGRTGEMLPIYFDVYEDYYNDEERLSIPNALSNIEQEVLIVHGTEDETVPVDAANAIHQKLENSKLLLIKGGSHTFNMKHPWEENEFSPEAEEVVSQTINFLKK